MSAHRHVFNVAPERPSRRARVRWLVMRHWWWMRGWCSRDGMKVYMRMPLDVSVKAPPPRAPVALPPTYRDQR